MSIELSNPPGIPASEFYRQMAVATGSRTVYLAGQVARTADGEPVGAAITVPDVYDSQVLVQLTGPLRGLPTPSPAPGG